MFSFVKTVKRPICKAFIEFTFRHIPLIFSVYLLILPVLVLLGDQMPALQEILGYFLNWKSLN
jgi:hypothetical protein